MKLLSKLLLIVVLIFLVLGTISFFLSKKEKKETSEKKIVAKKEAKKSSPLPVVSKQALNNQEQEIVNLATAFFGRYGTYTNKTNFKNITDLRELMSKSFQKERDAYVMANILSEEKVLASPFYKTRTEVVKALIDKKEENFALVKIDFLKQEQKEGEKTAKISYGKGEIKLIKEDEKWKIDKISVQ